MEKTNQEILSILYDEIGTRSRFVINAIKTDLEEITETLTQTTLIAIAIAFGILSILGIVIIWNQRKLKKQIRHLEDLLQQQTGQAEPDEKE